jgi:16S rRNA (guanine966-N2)-methyltransferase
MDSGLSLFQHRRKMRIIGGEFRSRVLKSVPGLEVRPTPDRLREALFNILSNGPSDRITGAVFADVYAGTGAVGIEALSRGASRAIFIEQSPAAVNVIRENLRSLGLQARAQIRQGRASVVLAQINKTVEIDRAIVFLDPPYSLAQEYERSLSILGERSPDPEMPQAMPLVIAQHASREELAESYGSLRRVRVVKHGDNALSFFETPE